MKATWHLKTFWVVAMLTSLALAHGDDDMGMDMSGPADQPLPPDAYPPTYFALREHTGAIYTHIALMVVAWVVLLPIAVMLSLARSRYTLLVQLAFLGTHAAGTVLGMVYNGATPDLYPGNAHHKIGWVATWFIAGQIVVGLLSKLARKTATKREYGVEVERELFIPISHENMAAHHSSFQSGGNNNINKASRLSSDSGQGTEPNTESLRSHSVSSSAGEVDSPSPAAQPEKDLEYDHEEDNVKQSFPYAARRGTVHRLAQNIAGKFSSKTLRILQFGYDFVDRTILILGFIAICTGIITFGRFFEDHQIFTGLAHWIKGGIFIWLGILTLGRWAGSFGELGWAWNVRPKQAGQKWRPSAEFVESALIFTYGITNIFLEHLGSAGGEYSAEDLEHVSITVLFIGGGLCGMLIESTMIRDLLNMTVSEAAHGSAEHAYDNSERDALRPPPQYAFSMNPFPALVILLLGIMMSSHTQASMISSMVHKQWGNLLTGASFARGFTYVIMYLKPPKSILPSRPPTELLAAFGLLAGGIIFMASSGDTVDGMIHYQLDAMFMYTVTMGLVGLLMAWVITLIAIKGWAVRKEAGRPAGSYRMA